MSGFPHLNTVIAMIIMMKLLCLRKFGVNELLDNDGKEISVFWDACVRYVLSDLLVHTKVC